MHDANVSVCKQVVESLYGQDLDSGQHGSGFPLPPYRQRLLEEHLARVAQAEAQVLKMCWAQLLLSCCAVYQSLITSWHQSVLEPSWL